MDWDDVPSDMRPPWYDDWYLDVMHLSMDEALGGGTSGEAPGENDGNDDTQRPVGDDWAPMSSDRADSAVLSGFFNLFWTLPRPDQEKYTYEQIIDIVGCEPSECRFADHDRPNRITYRWNSAESEDRHMYFVFDDVGGGNLVIFNWGSAGL
jgi:hypothetical protein